MSPEDFFARFTRTAWRLETLPQYLGTSDPAFHYFEVTGELIPLEQRPAKVRWMAAVREATRTGKVLGRVHVVSRPLTPYLRYEMASYSENVAAGETVRVAGLDQHPELAALDRDFWLLDQVTDRPTVILIGYDPDGRPTSMTVTQAPDEVERCRDEQALALACSVPLAEFYGAA